MTKDGDSRQRSAPERRARRRARYTTALLWHGGSFAIINTAFWLLDARGPGGIDWAFWITAPWAFALAFHTLAWLIDGHDLEERLTRNHLGRPGAERHSGALHDERTQPPRRATGVETDQRASAGGK